jgi:WSTF/HB1/Itc1p/MBD9 motif protein
MTGLQAAAEEAFFSQRADLVVASASAWRSSFVDLVQVFGSFEDAQTADDQFYADLTPEERLDILLELIERHRSALGETSTRFERVHRIAEIAQC